MEAVGRKARRVRRAIDLSFEVSCLIDGVEAGQILANQLRMDQFGTEEDFRRAPAALVQVLGLVASRMKVLASALRRDSDPSVLLNSGNEINPAPLDENDRHLRLSWTWDDSARILRRDLARIEGQQAKEGGPTKKSSVAKNKRKGTP